MARRGRKRKIGLRHPGGELVRPQFDFRGLATLQPYRVWLPQEKRLDQKAGSPLGCLNLPGVLSGGRREGTAIGVKPPRPRVARLQACSAGYERAVMVAAFRPR
jgi:hypothetical protein